MLFRHVEKFERTNKEIAEQEKRGTEATKKEEKMENLLLKMNDAIWEMYKKCQVISRGKFFISSKLMPTIRTRRVIIIEGSETTYFVHFWACPWGKNENTVIAIGRRSKS